MRRAIICAVIVAVSAWLILPFSTSAITPIRLDTPYTYVDARLMPFDDDFGYYTANISAYINNVTFENEINGTGAVFDITSSYFTQIQGANDPSDSIVGVVGNLSAIVYIPNLTPIPTLFEDIACVVAFTGGLPENDYSTPKVAICLSDGGENELLYSYEMPSNLTLTLTDYDPATADQLRKILLAFSSQGDITLKEYTEYIFGGITDIYGVFVRRTADIVNKPNIIMSLSFTALAVVLILACFALLYRLFRNGG